MAEEAKFTTDADGVAVDTKIWNHLIGFGRRHGLPLAPITPAVTVDMHPVCKVTEDETKLLVKMPTSSTLQHGLPGRGGTHVCAEGNWIRHNLPSVTTTIQAGGEEPVLMFFRLGPCTKNECVQALSALAIKLQRAIKYYTLDLSYCADLYQLWGIGSTVSRLKDCVAAKGGDTEEDMVHPLVTFNTDGRMTLSGWCCRNCTHRVGERSRKYRAIRRGSKDSGAGAGGGTGGGGTGAGAGTGGGGGAVAC